MTDNPLKSQRAQAYFTSGMRALEWAAIARSKNLTACAQAWEEAHKYGWDDEHYCPIKASQLAEARRQNG